MHFEHFGLTDLSRIQIIYFRKRQKVEFKVPTQNLRQEDVGENFSTKSLRQIVPLIFEISGSSIKLARMDGKIEKLEKTKLKISSRSEKGQLELESVVGKL